MVSIIVLTSRVSDGGPVTKCLPRFGNPSQLPSPLQDEYGPFADHFVKAFAPEIFKVYLHQIELFVSGQAWLSKKCQYQILQFFTEWFVLFLSVDSTMMR